MTKEPFSSDGCTLSPDFDFVEDCIEHDWDYWKGGTAADRARADAKLRKGIRSKGHPVLAEVYWVFVRVFGSAFWPFDMVWGEGGSVGLEDIA